MFVCICECDFVMNDWSFIFSLFIFKMQVITEFFLQSVVMCSAFDELFNIYSLILQICCLISVKTPIITFF